VLARIHPRQASYRALRLSSLTGVLWVPLSAATRTYRPSVEGASSAKSCLGTIDRTVMGLPLRSRTLYPDERAFVKSVAESGPMPIRGSINALSPANTRLFGRGGGEVEDEDLVH